MNQIISQKQKVTPSINLHIPSLRFSTAASCVPKSVIHELAPLKKPAFGDMALVRIVSIGGLANLEQEFGQRFPLFVGSEVVAVFANRYAPDQYEGIVSESLHNPIYATGYGLLKHAIKKEKQASVHAVDGPLLQRLTERMRSWVADFF